MKKILFVLPNLSPFGSQKVLVNIYNSINNSIFSKKLIVVTNNSDYQINSFDKYQQPTFLNKKRTYQSYLDVIRIIRMYKPEIIFSTLGHMNMLLILTKPFIPKKCKLIVRESNTPSIDLKYSKRPKINAFLFKNFYKFADKIVCQSENMKYDLHKNFNIPKNKLIRIYNPIDNLMIGKMIEEENNALHKDAYNIISIGRLSKQKNFSHLISAFSIAYKSIPNARLTILGEGPEKKHLLQLIDQSNLPQAIELVGFQSNPHKWLTHSDLFVSSSKWEGLPNVILESMACGVPVVATDCPGGTSELIVNNVNGLLIPPGDIDALAQGMIEAYLKKDTFSSDEIKQSVAKHDNSKIINQYETLFNEVIGD